MNYRHGFHAGNFADVQKHIILIAILDYLAQKESAFVVLDTHAGRGSYDLTAGQAARTREFAAGVGKILGAKGTPPLTRRYLEVVRNFNREHIDPAELTANALAMYPGSPRIARSVMRAQDRLIACELQPQEYALLKAGFHGDRQAAIHARDGWEALGALLPPKEKRGLVLIDPPYEAQEEELKLAATALKTAQQKFPNGIFALWYPIKERQPIHRFHQRIKELDLGNVLAAEICVWPDDGRLHLNGSGMIIVNPPWQLDAQLAQEQPWLWRHLSQNGLGKHDLRWLSRRE